MSEPWNELLEKIRLCRVCEGRIPNPNPVFRLSREAKILVVGQAPGRKVHETGIPWNDPSGDLLRQWLGLSKTEFYDASKIAILPAGLCYPGVKDGSDLPPRAECAPPVASAGSVLFEEPANDSFDRILCPEVLFEESK